MTEQDPQGIYVLAGPNGAGKSSVVGTTLLSRGATFFDPDEYTRTLLSRDASLSEAEANSDAWHAMVRLLVRAIDERRSFVFETTLGGSTIAGHLQRAAAEGLDVRIWYVALASPELHIERVRLRVAAGGVATPSRPPRSVRGTTAAECTSSSF